MLIEKEANVEARDQYGVSPLQESVRRFDNRLTCMLLRQGASVNSLNEDTMFAAQFSPIEMRSFSLAMNLLKMIKLLQSNGFRLNFITRFRMIKRWMSVISYEKDPCERYLATKMIRPELELFAADLFMTNYYKLNLPHVVCRKVAEKMRTDHLLWLCETTTEENLVQPVPRPKRPRLRLNKQQYNRVTIK
ncbi:hypothetical protein TKK_0005644 [Trichogramma kaykai]